MLSYGFPPAALPDQVVELSVGFDRCLGVTGQDGKASCSVVVHAPPGDDVGTARFNGTPEYDSSAGIASFEVTASQKGATVATFLGPMTAEVGSTVSLTGQLTDGVGSAVPGRALDLELGKERCTALTQADGRGTCTVTVSQEPGAYTEGAAAFDDADDTYRASRGAAQVTVLADTSGVATRTTMAGPVPREADQGEQVQLTGTLTSVAPDGSAGAPLSGQTLVLYAGRQRCSTPATDVWGTASCTVRMVDLTGSTTALAHFAGSSTLAASADEVPFEVTAESSEQTPTVVTYTGEMEGTYGDTATLAGTLSAGFPPAPLPGRTLRLSVGSDQCSAVTGDDGRASCEIIVRAAPGDDTALARFDGDEDYTPAAAIAPFTISKAQPALTWTGQTSFRPEGPGELAAVLADQHGEPLEGRELELRVGTGEQAQTCTASTGPDGEATCTVQVAQAGGASTVGASFAGDGHYLAASVEEDAVVTPPATVTWVGDTTADHHDPAELAARLTGADGGALAARDVVLTMATTSCSGTTDLDGVARCTVVVQDRPGLYEATAAFAGDESYGEASTSVLFHVRRQQSVTVLAIPEAVEAGAPVSLGARLTEQDGSPVPGRRLHLSLGSESCTAVTAADGRSACDVVAGDGLGPQEAAAAFHGDGVYEQSAGRASTTVFAWPSTGAFAVGDLSDSGHVRFFGKTWSADNALSGGPAPMSFDGLLSAPAACGATSTSIGKEKAPSSVPTYMAVPVLSRVDKSGSGFSADVARVVVVRTDATYSSKGGVGTVVARVC